MSFCTDYFNLSGLVSPRISEPKLDLGPMLTEISDSEFAESVMSSLSSSGWPLLIWTLWTVNKVCLLYCKLESEVLYFIDSYNFLVCGKYFIKIFYTLFNSNYWGGREVDIVLIFTSLKNECEMIS